MWAWTPPALAEPTPLCDTDETWWQQVVTDPLRRYVEFLQAAERRLRDGDRRLVVVVPTVGLGGAAGLVAWATVAEAQRSLAKSVARVWGASGIRVNCVAVSPSLLTDGDRATDRPNLQQPALDDPGLGEVAAVIVSFLDPHTAAVTGATIAVDGGRWMPS